ncbi:MAG TPA: hypothetical protein VJ933_02575, partial [Phaeodactylibacter sp.]|nr:hypothetical protein [Phaeodactylibacter sp.]
MDCSDERIIDLIKTAGRKAEHQSVKCLLKCEGQANALLIKQGLHDAEERRSVFYHAIVAFIVNVRRGRFALTGKAKICTYLTETTRRQWLKRY